MRAVYVDTYMGRNKILYMSPILTNQINYYALTNIFQVPKYYVPFRKGREMIKPLPLNIFLETT